MIPRIGSSFLYVAVLMILIVYILQWRFREKWPKIADNFGRILVISTSLLAISFSFLIYSFIIKDYSLIVVYNYSSNDMTLSERIMATWASRQGVMILWSLAMAIMTTISYYYLREFRENPVVARLLTVLFFFNALIASFIMSTRPPAFATQEMFTNGVGLNPSLLSFWQQLHPPIAFVAYSAFIYPFAYGVALLSLNKKGYEIPKKLHWLNDQFALLGWGMTTIFIVAGSIWGYEENWSGFWAWDPVEVASLIMWGASTLYFHVKSQVSDNHVLRYAVAALGWVGVAFASFVVRSGILSGLHTYVGGAQLYVFGSLLLGTILTLLYAISQSGEKLLPDYLYSWSKHNAKPKLLTFWTIVFFIGVNTIGIIMQMINAVALGITDYPYEYYIILNGFSLFLLGILLVFCEINYDKYTYRTVFSFLVPAILVSGIIFYLSHVTGPLVLTMISILSGSALILAGNMIISVVRNKNFRKFSIQLVHFSIVLMLVCYIGVDYSTQRVDRTFNEGDEVTIEEFGITINGTNKIIDKEYFILLTVVSNGEVIGNIELRHGIHQGDFWSKADWISFAGYDLYFHSTVGSMIVSETTPIEISVSRVPLANLFRSLFFIYIIVVPVGILTALRRRPLS